tara:strand:+ start:321 stop:1907 length:1587 start_codon:yes stop_codon:yes gene_type:complete
MAVTKTVKVQVDTGSSVQRLDEVKAGFDGIEESAKQGTDSTVGMTLAVKGLGLALKSAGIGLVISALVGLGNAFLNNQKFADQFNTGLEFLNITFKQLVEPLVDTAYWLTENTDVLRVMADAFSNMAVLIKNNFAIPLKMLEGNLLGLQATYAGFLDLIGMGTEGEFERLTEAMNQNKDEMIELVGETANAFGGLATNVVEGTKIAVVASGEYATRVTKNFEQGAGAILATSQAIVQLRNDVKLADAVQRELQLTFQKEAELQRQIRDDVSLTTEERIAANNKLGEILDEQAEAERKVALTRLELAQKELATDKSNIDLQVALIEARTELADLDERITSQRSEQLTNENALIKEQADLEKELAKQKEDDAQQEIEDGNRIRDERIKAAKAVLTATTKLAGEGTKVGKAAALTNILIDTALAISGAVKAAQAVPFPGNLAAIGTGIAAVMTNLASAKNILKKAGADGGGGDVGAVASTPAMGGIGGTIPNISAITTPETDMTPVQAFVVETDISDAQALQDELEIQATL